MIDWLGMHLKVRVPVRVRVRVRVRVEVRVRIMVSAARQNRLYAQPSGTVLSLPLVLVRDVQKLCSLIHALDKGDHMFEQLTSNLAPLLI